MQPPDRKADAISKTATPILHCPFFINCSTVMTHFPFSCSLQIPFFIGNHTRKCDHITSCDASQLVTKSIQFLIQKIFSISKFFTIYHVSKISPHRYHQNHFGYKIPCITAFFIPRSSLTPPVSVPDASATARLQNASQTGYS